MRVDLLADDDDFEETAVDSLDNNLNNSSPTLANKKWLAHPKTLRLSTRPRMPLLPDGTRPRTMKRISHSCPLPNFVFSLQESVESLAEKLLRSTLLHMFRKLHPEKSSWNLSLINVAVTNMAEAGGESKTASGRDIGNMLRKQEDVLKDFRVIEMSDENIAAVDNLETVSKALATADDDSDGGLWDDEDHEGMVTEFCSSCASHIPTFAMVAHQRFHSPAL